MPANILTIDVEEYFDADNVARALSSQQLAALPSRVEIGTRLALRLLERHRTTATFFVLGTVAERHPELIREVAAAGHEIASHGYRHVSLSAHTRASFELDLQRSLQLLEPLAGRPVRGFRAANFSLQAGADWFYDVLARNGIHYDSSVALSWFRRAATQCFEPYQAAAGVLEHPVSCLEQGPLRLPIGGGYFRLYPYWLTARALRSCERRGRYGVFYLHPWELDASQPRLRLGGVRALRHYYNLHTTERKLERLLAEHSFTSFAAALE